MTKKEYFAYLEEHYPKVYPCMKCIYWRGQSGSHESSPMLPMCHYSLVTGLPRESVPDFEKQYCKEFEAKKKR